MVNIAVITGSELKDYQSVRGFKVTAYQVIEDSYFDKVLAHKGDWIINWRGEEFLIPAVLFPMLFERKYASLEEACCENGVENG